MSTNRSNSSSSVAVSRNPLTDKNTAPRQERQTLVAVDQRLVLRDGVHQSRSLVGQRRVGIPTEQRGTRPLDGGVQQARVADRPEGRPAPHPAQQVPKGEVPRSGRPRHGESLTPPTAGTKSPFTDPALCMAARGAGLS